MGRPRPVLIYAAVMAGLTALTGYAGLDQLIPSQAVAWLALATVVVGAVGGALVQGQVTPLADPRAKDGGPLVAADSEGWRTTVHDGQVTVRDGAGEVVWTGRMDAPVPNKPAE